MAIDRSIEDKTHKIAVDLQVEGRTGPLSFAALKAGGIIKQRQKDLFTVRLKCPGGRVPLERLARIAEVARRYGNGYVHLSVRQSIEIPYVNVRDLGKVKEELAAVGQEIATCGARVRVPVACAGCEYNPKGLTDTQAMVGVVCERFFGPRPLAHKFKMAFAGCPNDCPHSSSNDLGFQGAVEPELDARACTGCGLCVKACKEGAITMRGDGGDEKKVPCRDPAKCLYCADCIRTCPADAWQARRTGWVVRVGGKHGRHPLTGSTIAEFVPDTTVPMIIDAILTWYEKFAADKGRARLGTLLQDPDTWRKFLADIAPSLGEDAVQSPPPPQPSEIHGNA
jgi:dissimilatory sulfite reductase (desulfoviridin) alpha/beta subunit